MLRFLLSYALVIYLGFVAFVLLEVADHPNPKDFATFFLTLWPLLFLAGGAEPFLHVYHQYKKDHGTSPPRYFKNDWLYGIIAGVSVVLLSVGAFWLWHFTMWAALINVAIPILLPATFYIASVPKPSLHRAAEPDRVRLMDIETKYHPTHRRLTYWVMAGLVAVQLSLLAISYYSAKVLMDQEISDFCKFITFIAFGGLFFWIMFRGYCCRCPQCKRWMFRQHKREYDKPRQFLCEPCQVVWDTKLIVEHDPSV